MKHSISVCFLIIMIALCVSAQQARVVPQAYLDTIVNDDPNPLPRHETPEEARMPRLRLPIGPLTPPSGAVSTPAEYALNEGLLISWGSFNDLLTQMTVGITTGDPEAIVYIVVDDASQEASATSTLVGAGADMSQVEFITYATDSVWMRDYGPRFIFEDGSRAIVDHTYNRPRPNDNGFPDYLNTLWGEAQYDIPLEHGGGNFHLFDNRDAFMSELVVNENPGQTATDIENLYLQYLNVDLDVTSPFPSTYDSTQHIDMWMLPVDDDEIIIGEYASSDGTPYTVTEDMTTQLESAGYTVYRTPGWKSGAHYTYTNSVVFNDLVFLCEFGGSYATQDAAALSTFQTAFENSQIIQVDCSDIISYSGALHCIVMHVPAYTTSMRVAPGVEYEAAGPVGGPFSPASQVFTVSNATESVINYEVSADASWLDVANPTGTIPAGSSVDVTVSLGAGAASLAAGAYHHEVSFSNLSDHSGDTMRRVSLLVGEAESAISFDLSTDPGWTTEGQWEWGNPTGGAGDHGFADPGSGYTGDNVYGYNLAGGYPNNLSEQHLTSSAIDCSSLFGVELKFWRWLGVEEPQWDHASIAVSTDAQVWQTVWQNDATIDDGAWVAQSIDISAIADDQPTVYLRWTMGSTDTAYTYCGWNIDDIALWGIQAGSDGLLFADDFETGDDERWDSQSP